MRIEVQARLQRGSVGCRVLHKALLCCQKKRLALTAPQERDNLRPSHLRQSHHWTYGWRWANRGSALSSGSPASKAAHISLLRVSQAKERPRRCFASSLSSAAKTA